MHTPKRRKLSVALVAALIAVLILSCAAFAASKSGLLERLYGAQTPPPDALALLKSPNQVADQDGVKFTIDEYLYDGNVLTLQWTAESTLDQPVFYRIGMPDVNGMGFAGGGSFPNVIGDSLVMLGRYSDAVAFPGVNAQSMQWQMPKELRNKPLEVTMTAYFLTTDRPISLGEPKIVDRIAIYDTRGDILVNSLGSTQTYAYPELLGKYDEEAQAAFIEQGYARPLTEIEVKLSVAAPGKAAKHVGIAGQNRFEFPDYIFEVSRLDFSAASAMVEFRIYPKRPLVIGEDGSWSDEDPLLNRRYLLLDEAGNDITQDLIGGWYAWIENQGEENEHILLQGDWDPIAKLPDALTIMPMESQGSDPGADSKSIPEEAVTVKLSK